MGEEYICKLYPFQTGAEIEELREEIIRCRDCKHFDPNVDEYIGEDGSNPKCNRLTYVFEKCNGGVKWLHRPTVSPDGFCAWAERDA